MATACSAPKAYLRTRRLNCAASKSSPVRASAARISEDHSGRPGLRVRQPRSRPVGLCQGRHARLLAAREADRQRLHRGVQRTLPQRVPEHALVPDPCGCGRKDGGLAQILQRGSAARGHRQQATDPAAKSRRYAQSAAVTTGRKLYPPAVQQMASPQSRCPEPRIVTSKIIAGLI